MKYQTSRISINPEGWPPPAARPSNPDSSGKQLRGIFGSIVIDGMRENIPKGLASVPAFNHSESYDSMDGGGKGAGSSDSGKEVQFSSPELAIAVSPEHVD